MKKRLLGLLISALMVTVLVGCASGSGSESEDKVAKGMKVGMVTDSGTIDDKSFNEGTWTGVKKVADDLNLDKKYLKPSGETPADYMVKIKDLYDGGFKTIVTPGFKFEPAIYEAQEKYKDAKFVLIDGSPKETMQSEAVVGDNTVAIFFAEEQSGFLAGIATALELKEGKLGFIGGIESPPVQKFNWGFQQGTTYANEKLGTKVELTEENIKYQGTFTDTAAGQQMAATMYDRGVKAIFASAGGVGVGAINEAKARVEKGEEVWIIGVDVDQYTHGMTEGGKSVILTSAMKSLDKAAYDMVEKETKGEFPGGSTLMYDVTNDGVGIPKENPNLSAETVKGVEEVFGKIKSGEIKVSNERGNLIQ